MVAAIPGVEIALTAEALLGEGPRWDEQTQTLLFVDIAREQVIRYAPDTQVVGHFDAGGPASAIALCQDNGIVLARGAGFVRCRADGTDLRAWGQVALSDARLRMNDGAVDPWGRFVVGSMDGDASRPIGAVYRLDATGRADELFAGVTISNGIAWSPDRRTMYYVDSATGALDAFDLDEDGNLTRRRRVLQLDAGREGSPDGVAVDEEGCIWVACWGASAVRRVTPHGHVDSIIDLPTSNVTSLAFGGLRLDDLYITTARFGLDEKALAEQLLAGNVFVVSPGVRGLPCTRFGSTIGSEPTIRRESE